METVLERFTKLLISRFVSYVLSFEEYKVIYYFEEGNASQHIPYEAPMVYYCSICLCYDYCKHHNELRHLAKRFAFGNMNFTRENLVQLIVDEFPKELLESEFTPEAEDENWEAFEKKIDEKFDLTGY